VDIGNAPRLGIHYVDESGKKKHPAIIHSAIPGGIERYLYAALDNFQQGIPLWLSPVQVRLIPVGAEYVAVCQKLVEQYAHLPLRIEIDDRASGVSSRLKSAFEDYVPHKLVIGQKEVENGFQEFKELLDELARELKDMPFIPREWPAEVSRQL
jgi:threonyl-tRNA synthetase